MENAEYIVVMRYGGRYKIDMLYNDAYINDLKVGQILAVRDHDNIFTLFLLSYVQALIESNSSVHAYKVKVLEKNRHGMAIKVKILMEVKL